MSYTLGQMSGAFATGSAAVDQILAQGNARLAAMLVPAHPAIDASPLPADEKQLLKSQPITFYLQAFGIIENVAAEIIKEANRLSGRGQRVIGLPNINQQTISMDPDDGLDAIASPSGRHLIRVLRIADCYMVLVYQDPLHLSQAVATVLAKYGAQGAGMVANFVFQAGQRAAQHAAAAVNMAQQAGAQAAQQAAGIVQAITANAPPPPSFPGFGSFQGLGDGGVGAGVGSGAAVAANGVTTTTTTATTTGVVSTPEVATVITALIGVMMAGGVGAVKGAGSGLNQGQRGAAQDQLQTGEVSFLGFKLPAGSGKYVVPGLLGAGVLAAALAFGKKKH